MVWLLIGSVAAIVVGLFVLHEAEPWGWVTLPALMLASLGFAVGVTCCVAIALQ